MTTWRKAAASGSQNCVEVAHAAGSWLIRDSKLGDDSPVLQFTAAEFEAFLAGVKRGEFDQP